MSQPVRIDNNNTNNNSKNGAIARQQRTNSQQPGEASATSGPLMGKSSSSSATSNLGFKGGGQIKGKLTTATTFTPSSSHRLSSIEILNENKQRQLQLKQQESFKLHLEQRQRYIQGQHQPQEPHQQLQQHQRQQTLGDRRDETASDLGVTYQVNTAVPDYMQSAMHRQQQQVNPFDAADSATGGGGGKSVGFLASLMGDQQPAAGAGQKRVETACEDELDTGKLGDEPSRYAKVVNEASYTYDYDNGGPPKKPFYEKDFATLLQECRASRKLVILVVAIALLLDNMLLTSVVPIIPAFLYKLRIERQHRELLESGNASGLLWPGAGRPGEQQSGTGRQRIKFPLDEATFEEELARRINQSMAAARDRFSGSIFHPRVRLNRPSPDDDSDDDDGRRREPNEDEDDDDDDGSDDDGDDNRRGHNNGRGDDDDDDKDKGKGRAPKTLNPSSKRPMRMRTRPGKARTTQMEARKDDDDGDDEVEAASKWNRLKFTLAKRAKGNDSDTALGGMCLNMVLGPAPSPPLPASSSPSLAPPQPRKKDSDHVKADDDDDDDDYDRLDGDDEENAGDDSRPLASTGRPTDRRRTRRRTAIRPPLARVRPRTSSTSTSSPQVQAASDEDERSKKEKEEEPLVISHQDIVEESFEVGVMFASKPIVQAFANPFIGSLTNKVGFTIPMFTGFVIMFLSTLVFAFGSTYSTLFVARAIQGVGSACTSVAGMAMLADRFPEDAERGPAMAVALGGLALGVVIGPPFGGFMYEFVGKASPFIVLSILALFDGLLQLLVLQPRVSHSHEEGASLMTLIRDPYILVAAGAITFANTGIAILEPALPLWMMDTMQAKNWEQGVAFLPAALSYMFGTNLFGNLGHKIGRWRSAMLGLVIIGCSLLLIPFASRVDHLIVPNGAIGFAMGMVDSTMMPMLGYLVDIRHTSVYGSVYAIGDVAFCASFAFGPALSGTLVELIGFEGLVITTALICFGFAPLLLLLRDPPPRQVALAEAQLAQESSMRYVNYAHLDASPTTDEEAAAAPGRRK